MTKPLLCASLVVSFFIPRSDERAQRDAEQIIARGREALAAGKYGDASSAFSEAVKLKPTEVRAWILLARASCNEAEVEAAKNSESNEAVDKLITKAEEAARKAVELDRLSAFAWAELGHVLSRAGNIEEAIATLYHAEKLGEPTIELLVDLADDLLAARQTATEQGDDANAKARVIEARSALERAQRLAASQVVVARRLALVCKMLSDDAGTLSALRRAALMDPANTDTHEALIKETVLQHGFDDAIRFYTGLVDEPALSRWYASRAHELKGNWLFNTKRDYATAADEYRKAEDELVAAAKLRSELTAQVDAYVPTLRASRGAALTRAERFPEAEAALFSAIDLAPTHEGALVQLHALQDAMWKKYGGEAMPQDKFEEIRSFAAKLCVVEPDKAENWNNLGFFARDTRHYEESNRAYRRAVALEPDNARYLNDAALILLYHLGRDFGQARTWLEASIKYAKRGIDDENRRNEARIADKETLGDAYSNLINVVNSQGDIEYAKKILDEFEKDLPKRYEVATWRSRLTPEKVATPEPAPATPPNDEKKTDGADGKTGNNSETPKGEPVAKSESDGDPSDVTPEDSEAPEGDDD